MNKITVLHNGGGWITNIGNAFLDFGSMQSIKMACPDADVHVTSVLNRWVSYHVSKGVIGKLQNRQANIQNVFNLQDYGKIDYVTQSGAFLASHWFDLHGSILMNLKEKGVKFIINGGGMTDTTYCQEEIEKTSKLLKLLKPYAFISRDEVSFDYFKDYAEHSYNGIDCAFFLSDYFRPMSLDFPPYVALNFDKEPEPNINDIVAKKGLSAIRTHHSFWHNFRLMQYPLMKSNYFQKENTLISEIPQDYLNIYANATSTYSDRVHACVASFSYGVPARLYSKSPRSSLFSRIGAEGISKELVVPQTDIIEKEKKKQLKFLSDILAKR